MLTQTSKAALASKLRTELVVTATRSENARVSALLRQRYSPTVPDGEPPQAWDSLQESNARLLELMNAEVLAADDRHRRNLVAASQLRRERDKLVRALEGRIRKLRLVVTGHHGPEALALVGLEAPPADSLAGLTKQAQDVLRRLRDPVRELPPPRSGLPALDRTQIADGMEAEVRELNAVMAALVEVRKRTDRSLVAKHQALDRHHECYLNVARIQEAYFRLAGLHELADRIRPFPRSRRRAAEPAATTAQQAPDRTAQEAVRTPAAPQAPAGGPTSVGDELRRAGPHPRPSRSRNVAPGGPRPAEGPRPAGTPDRGGPATIGTRDLNGRQGRAPPVWSPGDEVNLTKAAKGFKRLSFGCRSLGTGSARG